MIISASLPSPGTGKELALSHPFTVKLFEQVSSATHESFAHLSNSVHCPIADPTKSKSRNAHNPKSSLPMRRFSEKYSVCPQQVHRHHIPFLTVTTSITTYYYRGHC